MVASRPTCSFFNCFLTFRISLALCNWKELCKGSMDCPLNTLFINKSITDYASAQSTSQQLERYTVCHRFCAGNSKNMRQIGSRRTSSSRNRFNICSTARLRSHICSGISSNLSQLSLCEVIAQINSYDELLKFSNPIKEINATDFPPTANQTQFSSFDARQRSKQW